MKNISYDIRMESSGGMFDQDVPPVETYSLEQWFTPKHNKL
jgi:hypothetical protein